MTTYIILFTITTLFIALLFVYRKKSKETPSPTEKSSEARHLEAQKKADAEKRRAEEERRAKEETEKRVQAAKRAKEQEREAARLKALEEKQKREAERRKRESAAKAETEERARREEAARQKAQMAAREKEREEKLKRAAHAAKEKAEKEAAEKREVAKRKSAQAAETPRKSSKVSAPITLPDYPAFSHERLLEMGLSDEDAKAFVQELIEQIETEIPLIEAAMLQHDFHQMERVTHGIKGSSTNVGTGGVTDLIVAYNTYLKTGTDMAVAAIYHTRLKKELERLKTQYCSTK